MTKRKEPEPQERDEIRWRNKDSISDLLLCTICQDVFSDPMRVSCGHSFCKKCLEDWYTSSRKSECPTCRTVAIKGATHRDLLAASYLEREEVFCPVETCNWMGALGELHRHMPKCKEDQKAEDAAFDEKYRNNKSLQEVLLKFKQIQQNLS